MRTVPETLGWAWATNSSTSCARTDTPSIAQQTIAIVACGNMRRIIDANACCGRILLPSSLRLDLVVFGERAFELVVEQPHRVHDLAEVRGGFCPVGAAIGEDAVVAQIAHDRRIGNAVGGEVA